MTAETDVKQRLAADWRRTWRRARHKVNYMIGAGLTRVVWPCYLPDGSINIKGFEMGSAMLEQARRMGFSELGGCYDRGDVKDHGTGKRFEGYAPIKGKTLWLK